MLNDFTPHRPPDDPDELDVGLVAFITSAWSIGWMPGDLLAMVDHELSPQAARLAAALILREHREQGYGDRLPPRWLVQINRLHEVAGDDDHAVTSRHRGWSSDGSAGLLRAGLSSTAQPQLAASTAASMTSSRSWVPSI